MEKLVSVVLPVYNGEKYLAQSIESVLNQTYKNIELIIVNDCSTDGTEKIILLYAKKDKRIKYLKNEANLKLPKSLNKGFSIATGEYYTWTSDDNYYDLSAIKKMVDFLTLNAKYEMVCCDNMFLYEDTGKTMIYSVDPNRTLFDNRIGACFLYRQTTAKKIGVYAENLFLVEDYDYWRRIYLNGKIGVIHELLYYYRLHENSLTERKKDQVALTLKNYHIKDVKNVINAKIPKKAKFIYVDWVLNLLSDKTEKGKLKRRLLLKHPSFVIVLIKQRFGSKKNV